MDARQLVLIRKMKLGTFLSIDKQRVNVLLSVCSHGDHIHFLYGLTLLVRVKSEWVGQQDRFRKEIDAEGKRTQTQRQNANAKTERANAKTERKPNANAHASTQGKEEKEKVILLGGRLRPYIQQNVRSLVIEVRGHEAVSCVS